MASFSFGFQLGGEEQPPASSSSSSSNPSATPVVVAAPPSFTAAAALDTTAGALPLPPPPCVVVPLLESSSSATGAAAAAAEDGGEETREVPIGVGPPMCVTDRLHGVMDNVPEGIDLLPGVYEGGLKVWESSVDLVRFMRQHQGVLPLGPTHAVLELGCGHGLPGIHALQSGARVCFMDLNAEVLAGVTRRNIALNSGGAGGGGRALLVSGDWADASRALRKHWSDGGHAGGEEGPYFDLILSAETFYTGDVTDKLLAAIHRHLKRGGGGGGRAGQALVAGKRFYFGTHGSVADLVPKAQRLGLEATVVASVEDGRSNIRDIVRLTWR